jgi:hypothetical protein
MSKYERIKSSENKNYRYRTTVFIICLLVSALLWLTIKFSSDYTVEIPYSINLKGIPEGKVLVNQPDSVLRINVKASGYALLKCRYLSRHDSYEVNVSQWIGRISAGTSDATINTLLIAQHIKEERSLPGIIEFVSPEELSLKFDRGVSKQVPIIPDVSYSFAQQYFAYDSLIIEPQLATIYGTTDDIDRVHFLKTNALKFDDLSESIDTMVNILNPRSNAIVIEPEQAWISLLVEKKQYFISSIPLALINVKWLLENEKIPETLPEIRKVLEATLESNSLDALVKPRLILKINSFSYKRGFPADTSGHGGGFVFDCRALPNPGRYPEYIQMTGLDEPVQAFFSNYPEIDVFIENAYNLVKPAVEVYVSRGFQHLMVSFGCTGGRHRSVYCAEKLAEKLKGVEGVDIFLRHLEQ